LLPASTGEDDVENGNANDTPHTLGAMFAQWMEINEYDPHDVSKGNVLGRAVQVDPWLTPS